MCSDFYQPLDLLGRVMNDEWLQDIYMQILCDLVLDSPAKMELIISGSFFFETDCTQFQYYDSHLCVVVVISKIKLTKLGEKFQFTLVHLMKQSPSPGVCTKALGLAFSDQDLEYRKCQSSTTTRLRRRPAPPWPPHDPQRQPLAVQTWREHPLAGEDWVIWPY